ncbi:MAG: outer membrane beta-barrel protein [Bacteroidetes bacterium]|nr:outer membrane beta-barrel protein [Bacteroidota bacterium]
MKKRVLQLITFSFLSVFANAQIEHYGPFVGGNVFVYKSNLYNAKDLASDSVQKYKATMGFSGGFDFGYRMLNGISISSGISFGTSNQKYASKDSIVGDVVDFKATTKMSFIKIPIVLSMQTRNDKPTKAYYSLGLFYSYNTGFSDNATWDYKHNSFSPDRTMNIDGEIVENLFANDKKIYSSKISERPYRRHGWGAILGLGASKRFSEKAEWFIQSRIEYQVSSSENTDELIFNPTPGSVEERRVGRVFGNYAKYMQNTKSSYDRPATHPFNIGLTFGLRYYLFDFQ